MLNKYSVVLDPAPSSLFMKAFADVAKREGFASILKLAAPGTGVLEFQRQDVIISLHTFSAEGEKENLAIGSETFDLTHLISTTLREVTTELLGTFLGPMGGGPRHEIEERVRGIIAELLEPIEGSGPG